MSLLSLMVKSTITSSSALVPAAALLRKSVISHDKRRSSNPFRANLAREGHSVFLIEAGSNRGDDLLQQVPRW
jgi:hypothetical protein